MSSGCSRRLLLAGVPPRFRTPFCALSVNTARRASTASVDADLQPWNHPDWAKWLPSAQIAAVKASFRALEAKAEKLEERAGRLEAEKQVTERDLREGRHRSGFYEFRAVFEQARARLMSECDLRMSDYEKRPVDLWNKLVGSPSLKRLREEFLAPYPKFKSDNALAHEVVRLHGRLSSAHHRLVFANDRTFLVFPSKFLPTAEDRDLAKLFYRMRDPGVEVDVGIDILDWEE